MEYFILKPNGEQTGTFSIEEIRAMLEKGVIGPDTQYWHEGIDSWRPVTRIEESLNFQLPAPDSQKTTPPQPRKLPLSSREVLRPDASLKKSSRAIASSVTPELRPATQKLEPKLFEAPVPPPTENSAVPEPSAQPEAIRYEAAAPIAKKSRLLQGFLYTASVVVLALALDYGGPLLHKVSDLFQSEVTLNNDETFVLLDPAQIKPYLDDMQNFPPLDHLRHQLAQTTDLSERTNLQLGIQKSETMHTNEIQQRYLAMHKAERLTPGVYKVVKRYDADGNLTTLRADASTWYAISTQGLTVYARKSSETPAQ